MQSRQGKLLGSGEEGNLWLCLGVSEPRQSRQEGTLDLSDICSNQECRGGLVNSTNVRQTYYKTAP